MNLSDGKLVIEVGDDPGLRKAAVAKILAETAASLVGVLLVVNALYPGAMDRFGERVMKRVRRFLFGPPPPTEEEIRDMNRQVQIEAKRILREGQ